MDKGVICLKALLWISDNVVWGVPMLALMLFTGIMLSVRSGFFQLRKFPEILKSTVFSKSEKNDEISPFAAMCQALAATLGTGNIAGVSTAVAIGGAGAVFWMWVSAIFGMMTGFAENVLGLMYRKRENGVYKGGAMYYIRDGLAENPKTRSFSRPLSLAYAALCVASGFGMGNAAQMNSASEAMKSGFGVPTIVTGIVLAVLAAFIVFGGAKRISAFSAKLVPLMSGFYIVGCVYILVRNYSALPDVFGSVFKSAFGLSQIGGGVAGAAVKTAVSMGFKRGVFSNEAGLGTSVFAHTASGIQNPAVCGMWSVFEIFFDTIVMCSLTALTLLSSPCNVPISYEVLNSVGTSVEYFRVTDSEQLITEGITLPSELECITADGKQITAYVKSDGVCYSNLFSVVGNAEGGEIVSATIEPIVGVGLVEYAFSQTFGKFAGGILAVLVVMFAFSTVLGWSYFAGEAVEFLWGKRIRKPFCVVFVIFSVVGAVVNMSFAWGVADLMNGLMAIPNLIAVILLSGKAVKAAKEAFLKRKAVLRNEEPPKRISD